MTQAAAIGGLLGLLDALTKGTRRPFLHVALRALGSASAMSNHRLVDRAQANERYARLSTQTADTLDALLDQSAEIRHLRSGGVRRLPPGR